MSKKNIVLIVLLIILSIAISSRYLANFWNLFTVWLYPEDSNKNANTLKLIFSIIGGFVIIFGLYISFKRVLLIEKSVNIQEKTLKTQNKVIINQTHEIELSRKSQLNEQFKIAVEHIGNKNKAVVIGGLMELVFLAEEDSSKYAEIVHKIFCSYLKSIASLKIKEADLDNYLIQNIIDLFFNSKVLKNKKSKLNNLNFYNCDFQGLTFNNVDFSNSKMPKNIINCNFKFYEFSNTKFVNKEIELRFIKAFSEESKEAQKVTSIQNVKFAECNGTPSFHFCNLSNIDFKKCENLFLVSFTNCSLNKITGNNLFMPGSIHYFTQFSNIEGLNKIKHINFTCCDFLNIDFSNYLIERCIFSYCSFTNIKMASNDKRLNFKNNKIIELRKTPKYYFNINFVPIDEFLKNTNKFEIEKEEIYKYSNGKILVGNANEEYQSEIKKGYSQALKSLE